METKLMKYSLIIVLVLALSLMLMTACSNDSASEDMGATNDVTSDDGAKGDDQNNEKPFDIEAIKENIEITEIGPFTENYINATERGYATLAKNNSDQDIVLKCSMIFYGEDGEPVAKADSMNNYVKAGGTALLYACDEMEPFGKADVELIVEQPNYTILSDQMDVKETLRSDKVIFEMTNKSNMDAEPAGAAVAFYNGDELVDCRYVYCTKHDDPLEAGGTVTEDIDWIGNSSVDSVKIYPNAMSNGTKTLPESLEGDICKEDFIVGGDAADYWSKNVYSGNTVTFISTNDVTEVLAESGDFRWVFYSPGEDASEESVITTARGIHLGETKDAVFKAYGKGKEVRFNPEKDQLYNGVSQDEQSIVKEKATKSVEYKMKDGSYSIVFYFDSDDKVSIILFARA